MRRWPPSKVASRVCACFWPLAKAWACTAYVLTCNFYCTGRHHHRYRYRCRYRHRYGTTLFLINGYFTFVLPLLVTSSQPHICYGFTRKGEGIRGARAATGTQGLALRHNGGRVGATVSTCRERRCVFSTHFSVALQL